MGVQSVRPSATAPASRTFQERGVLVVWAGAGIAKMHARARRMAGNCFVRWREECRFIGWSGEEAGKNMASQVEKSLDGMSIQERATELVEKMNACGAFQGTWIR
jgi:predicted Rossmann-fold nucleotide-binding protein